MLVRFNVKNFLSFDKQPNGKSEEFTMIAGKVRSKDERLYKDENIKLLKFAALYGANASGKSNFIKALDFMRNTVVTGKLPVRYSNFYCRVAEENKNKESYFEVQLMVNNKCYLYGFTVLLSTGDFLSEWLYEVGNNSETKIFERDIKKGQFTIEPIQDNNLAVKFDVYTDDIKKNSGQLFLYFMNDNKDNLYQDFKSEYQVEVFKSVYEWFVKVLDINYPDRPISSSLYLTDKKKIKLASDILKAFDTGINELKLVDVPINNVKGDNIPQEVIEKLVSEMEADFKEIKNKKKVKQVRIVLRSKKDYYIFSGTNADNITCQSLKFKHNQISPLFDLIEESDGTIRILELLDIILSEEKKVYVIDELDRCLHPNLTYKFIQTFFNSVANKLDVQLIVTTHESRLLDFNLLRRDEIWFIDKKQKGNCDIYSLDEYNERFDKKIDKAYLEGRYGGVPLFTTIFPIEEL